ncbi:MAG: nucleoside hydrolase [Chitinivibrionales bacterium]|nr:nucleoside hydrolase [Chitinivibrionales bacterium]MBD3396604.1 nucleoside hydrolase [Chitinivibrionales bacterium]
MNCGLVATILNTARLIVVLAFAACAVPNIILDTDFGGDVDDCGALAVLHALADNGECNILAVMLSVPDYLSGPAVDVVNTFYSRPDLPIGVAHRDIFEDRTFSLPKSQKVMACGSYAEYLADNYPHDVATSDELPLSTNLYRQILASRPDTSVTIVTVGYLINIAHLLQSPPDEYSDLCGRDLVAKKVKAWSCMGGAYPEGREWNFWALNMGPATKFAVDNWPRPVTFSGYEIGSAILTGSTLAEETPYDNPIRRAYDIYLCGEGKNRESWDLTAVLYAVRGLADYWAAETNGCNEIAADGSNAWQASPDKQHAYLKQLKSTSEMKDILDGLLTQPPGEGEPYKTPVAASQAQHRLPLGPNGSFGVFDATGRLITRGTDRACFYSLHPGTRMPSAVHIYRYRAEENLAARAVGTIH